MSLYPPKPAHYNKELTCRNQPIMIVIQIYYKNIIIMERERGRER